MNIAKMPWFRLYSEAIDDEKLRLIAAEDRWYFVAILCCKGQGVLDKADALLKRKVAVKLGVQVDTLDEIARRLSEVGLIDRETLQPLHWEARQMRSDTSTERVRRHREAKQRSGNGGETLHETDGQRSGNALEEEEEEDKDKVKNKYTTQTRKRAADPSPPLVESEGNDEATPSGGSNPAAGAKALPGGSERRGSALNRLESASMSVDDLAAEGVDRSHARDWLTLRKAKRLPLTPTAWASVKAEAAACAMTAGQAVKHAVESNWAGFKATWVLDSPGLARASPRAARNDRSAAAAAIFPRKATHSEVIDV